jgi:uncharacterized protein (TIGR02246 family)
MEIEELVARESVRDLVARYNASGDSGRFDEMLALFTDEAVMEVVPGRSYRGREEIRTLFTGAAGVTSEPSGPAPRLVRHFTATHQIDLRTPDEATGRCYYAVLTEQGLDHWGRYVDRYVRREGRWLFAARRVTVDGQVPGGWGERAAARLQGA